MPVTQQYAQTLVGQWVDCHTATGVHTGILREVRPDGIIIEMPRTTSTGYVNGQKEVQFDNENIPSSEDAESVFFNPFVRFFIPFFLLLALTRRRRFF